MICFWKRLGGATTRISGYESIQQIRFSKKRIAVEVQFGHASFLGTDLLKFQMASYSNLDLIDFGVYITTTKAMQKFLTNQYGHNWEGSLLKKLKNTCTISKAKYKFQYTEFELMFNHFSYFPESYNYTRAKTVGIV